MKTTKQTLTFRTVALSTLQPVPEMLNPPRVGDLAGIEVATGRIVMWSRMGKGSKPAQRIVTGNCLGRPGYEVVVLG